MGDLPLRTPTHRRLGGPLLHQLANAPHAYPSPESLPLNPGRCLPGLLRGIRPDFSGLSPLRWASCIRVTHPCAGRQRGGQVLPLLPLDLHVLSLSLAFILSQDQTLRCCLSCLFIFYENFSKNTFNIVAGTCSTSTRTSDLSDSGFAV